MSDTPFAQHAHRREWEILKCDNNGDRFIHGPDTNDNEFVKVREVLPGEIAITREELYRALMKHTHRVFVGENMKDSGAIVKIDNIADDLFGPMPEGYTRPETEEK